MDSYPTNPDSIAAPVRIMMRKRVQNGRVKWLLPREFEVYYGDTLEFYTNTGDAVPELQFLGLNDLIQPVSGVPGQYRVGASNGSDGDVEYYKVKGRDTTVTPVLDEGSKELWNECLQMVRAAKIPPRIVIYNPPFIP